jgi:ribosomal protein S18 acetylase RimI-like enzyme
VTRTTATPSLPGQQTLIECWRAIAAASPGATVVETPRSVSAVFPSFAAMNNAIVLVPHDIDLAGEAERLNDVYGRAAASSWALWIPSPSATFDAVDEVPEIVGMKRDTTTLVMAANADATRPMWAAVRPVSVSTALRASDEPIPFVELAEATPDTPLAGWVAVDGEVAVAGAYRYLHESDCGIYAVGTAPHWRRRGIARRLLEHVIADAARRGARTATLQSVAMAQTLYGSMGFEPVGRYEEWVPE